MDRKVVCVSKEIFEETMDSLPIFAEFIRREYQQREDGSYLMPTYLQMIPMGGLTLTLSITTDYDPDWRQKSDEHLRSEEHKSAMREIGLSLSNAPTKTITPEG